MEGLPSPSVFTRFSVRSSASAWMFRISTEVIGFCVSFRLVVCVFVNQDCAQYWKEKVGGREEGGDLIPGPL